MADNLHTIIRGMIREEIDRTPGFRELTSHSDFPANIEAEKSILGAILLENAAHGEARLQADDFSLDSHQRIFEAMQSLIESKRSADIVTLPDMLGVKIKEIGGVAYLASLTEGLPRRPAISEYIQIIKEKAKLRRIIQACTEAIKSAHAQNTVSAAIVEQLGKDLKGIRKA